MKSFNDLVDRMKRGPTDAVGIDVGISGTKVVRMQKHDTAFTLVAADVLAPINLQEASQEVAPLNLPAKLKGKHACLAATGENAIIKLLSFPGHMGEDADSKVVENLGIEDASAYRISYKVIAEGHGRSESKVLAVALPDAQARVLPLLLPSGVPVPFSIEVAGLAAMTAFLHACGPRHSGDAVGAIEFGTSMTTFTLFNKGALSLVRRFSFGTGAILDKVREKLGVDADTAQGIMTDGSFDISQPVNEAMDPLIKQLIVSRDFVERRENCHIGRIYVSGGLVASSNSMDEIKSLMEVEVERWNPFESLTVAPDAIPKELSGREWQFAAAVGACLGTFEEI